MIYIHIYVYAYVYAYVYVYICLRVYVCMCTHTQTHTHTHTHTHTLYGMRLFISHDAAGMASHVSRKVQVLVKWMRFMQQYPQLNKCRHRHMTDLSLVPTLRCKDLKDPQSTRNLLRRYYMWRFPLGNVVTPFKVMFGFLENKKTKLVAQSGIHAQWHMSQALRSAYVCEAHTPAKRIHSLTRSHAKRIHSLTRSHPLTPLPNITLYTKTSILD